MRLWSTLGILLVFGGCHENSNPIESICHHAELSKAVACLKELPKRDLRNFPSVQNYLSKHKVYISLSSSPERLEHLHWVLQTLDLENVEAILLTLPKLYKNKHPYQLIPETVLNFPKLRIIGRDLPDVGPASKIVYALDLVNAEDPDALVISIDDDTGLPRGAINELILASVQHPEAVVGGSGRYIKLFGIDDNEWPNDPTALQEPFCGKGNISYCHILEGFKAIAYRARHLNTKRVIDLANTSKACLLSDDLIISYVLAESQVPRLRVSTPQFRKVLQFEFGFRSDALHKTKNEYPEGFKPRFAWSKAVGVNDTADRYQQCAFELLKLKNSP